MNKQELIDYISFKQEAIEFWSYLKSIEYRQEKINRLRGEIKLANIQLNRLEGKALDIRLNWMKIKNFKGIKNFTLNINGQNAMIYGDNGTGKTTQMDAFLWLLFGKDSSDRSNFKVKPQDEEGNDIHHLQTEVEVELLIDSDPLQLKKMQEEKWTKKRGSEEAELTGNTISYWWDEVPVREGEYKRKISELIDENIFRMITNPMYFNTTLKWQDRRDILLEMCGNITDEQVINADKKLSKLKEVLKGRSVDDYKKILSDKIKGLEKERADIPPRIDELTLSLPQSEVDYSKTEAELKGYKLMINSIEQKMIDASELANAYRRKQQELYSLKNKLEEVKNKIDSETGTNRSRLIEEKGALESKKYSLDTKIKHYKLTIEQSTKRLELNAAERQRLIDEWKTLNVEKAGYLAEEFIEPDGSGFLCPTCGQELPVENKEAKLADMKKKFEERKKINLVSVDARIEANKTKGLSLKADTEATQGYIDDSIQEIQNIEKEIKDVDIKIAKIDENLSIPVTQPDYMQDAECVELFSQIEKLQAELEKPVEDTSSQLIQRKNEIQDKINSCNSILHSKTKVEETKERIEELKEEEKRVATLITELEGYKYLLEQFIVSKVNMLEGNINSHFKYVRFRLFEENITNEGIKETCVALVNTNGSDVPSAETNHAGKVNAGLDCINALGNYYGVTAPIFVDFSESVSEYIETNSQIISLVKPETFDKLDKILQDALIEEYGGYDVAKKFWNDRNKVLRVEVK